MTARSPSLTCGILATGALLAALTTTPAAAHHSFAMYNRDKQVKVSGTVHDFLWTNPHAWVDIDVPGAQGGLEKWGLELNSPSNLARQGWRSDVMKPGDKVTIVLNPLRSGEKGGLFLQATLSDGRVIADAYLTRVTTTPNLAQAASAAAK